MALSPDGRSLLARYKAEQAARALPPASRQRVLEALRQGARGPLDPRTDVDPKGVRLPSSGTLLAKAAGSMVTKGILSAVALGTAGAIAWSAHSSAPSSTRSSGPPILPAPAVVPALRRAEAPSVETASAPIPQVRVSDLPRAPGVPASHTPSSRAAPASSNGTAPVPAPVATALPTPDPVAAPTAAASGGEDDIELLATAHRALAAGDPERALALIDEHRARFPRSVLTAERDATKAIALCQSGRAAAGAAAALSFLRDHPGSAFEARLRSVCGLGAAP